MKTVLIISYSWLHKDPRILRQIQALKNNYEISTIGLSPSNINGINHYSIEGSAAHTFLGKIVLFLQLFFRRYESCLQGVFNNKELVSLHIPEPDVIIANDYDGLYLAGNLIRNNSWSSKVYFDAHEYSPKQRKSLIWKIVVAPQVNYVLHNYKKYISTMTTVCEGIAREYEKYLKYPNNSIDIITNAPMYEKDLKPQPVGGKIKLIHHGGAIRERKLEKMIDMMKYLDSEKYDLTFMLVPSDKKYYDHLVKKASIYKNIHFIEPVPFNKIISFSNQFDIGIFLLAETNFNYKHALPNKLFEFIQSRLVLCIGPSIEMKNIVNKFKIGQCAKDFKPKSLAKIISNMTKEDIMTYKKTSDSVAIELGAEKNIEKIQNIINHLSN